MTVHYPSDKATGSPLSPRRTDCERWMLGVLLGVMIATASGCGSQIDTTYGKRRGRGAQSIAGTSVFGKMVEAEAESVDSWSRISPKLDDYDIIFWFPDDFQPPDLKRRAALERWLASDFDRTLVYVGRDFDANSAYWEEALTSVPSSEWESAQNQLAQSRAAFEARRAAFSPNVTYGRWFTLDPGPRQKVTRLQSSNGWARGVDVEKLDLSIGSQLRAPIPKDLPSKPVAGSGASAAEQAFDVREWEQRRDDEIKDRQIPVSSVLLSSNAGPIVRVVQDEAWPGSRILVVSNSGFLLNMALVNSEHRVLAQRLIDECNVEDKSAVFLESGPGGPPVYNEDPGDATPTGLELFTVWPIGFIMLHLLGLGVLSCFVLFPNFGRPRGLPPSGSSDFGKHVAAVGELLSHTGSQAYVSQQLRHYHLQVKRESGASHIEEEDAPPTTLPTNPVPPRL